MKNIIKTAIVEDRTEIREGLKLIINNSEGFECFLTFENAEEAVKTLLKEKVDVVLMDIDLPGISGIECTSILKTNLPEIQIIMLTVFDDSEQIFKALENGASGYLLKKTPPEKILESIKQVLNGESPMSGEIARKVVQFFNKKQTENIKLNLLSVREKELLELLSQGFRYKQIADKLFISIDTVRTHIRHIYEKLQVNSKIDALNETGLRK